MVSEQSQTTYPAAQHSAEHGGDLLPLYLGVFFTLMALLCITWGVYYIPFEKVNIGSFNLGFMNTAIALAIACTKGLLVVLIFMHLYHSTKLTRLVAAAGFIWLLIFILFTFADYLSRHVVPGMGEQTAPMIQTTPGQMEH